jgi:hypothetical protein
MAIISNILSNVINIALLVFAQSDGCVYETLGIAGFVTVCRHKR